jgi:hypothetical protein
MTPPNLEYITRCRVRGLRALLLHVINQRHTPTKPPMPPTMYRLIQYGHHLGNGTLEWLNANGHHDLTICPVCHTDNFNHLSDCTELHYGGIKS